MAGAEFEAELEVGDGVGGHEQFESEEARQQVLVDVGGPQAGLVLLLEPLADLLDHLEKKCAGAGGRVENEDAVGFLFDRLCCLPGV